MTINQKELKALLAELYAIDPALSAKEAELIVLIKRLAQARPEVKFDERAKAAIRQQLLAEARGWQSSVSRPAWSFDFTGGNRLAYFLSGATVFALAFLMVMNRQPVAVDRGWTDGKPLSQQPGSANIFAKNVLPASAFGPLSSVVSGSGLATGMGGGAGVSAVAPESAKTAPAADANATKMMATDSRILPMPMTEYEFVYKGEPVDLSAGQLEVLRRQKGAKYSGELQTLLSGLDFGALNLASFKQLELGSASLVQRQDFGYAVNVLFDDSSVSVYQNWEYWPAGKCGNDQACMESQRVKPEELLADNDAIALADEFIKAYNIDISAYDRPRVLDTWRSAYEATTDKAQFYFPETVEVVYPLKLDGKEVFDEWSGWSQGLQVSVHIKTKRVSGLYGLSTQRYDSSQYQAETDFNRLMQYAQKSGWGWYGAAEGAADKLQLELGTPSQGWLRYWQYKNGKNEELLLPALIFPINNTPKQPYGPARERVVVPLIKEVIDQRLNQVEPMPMPLAEPAAR